MIKIGKPTICLHNDKAFLEADIYISNDAALKYKQRIEAIKYIHRRTDVDYPPKIWESGGSKLKFEVDSKYMEYLCTERSDAFVVAFLWYAIIAEEDIIFEAPMSERLYNGLTKNIIPALCKDEYRQIVLSGPLSSEKLGCQGAVGTGMTCGVDSFYTMRTHKLTHLAYFTHSWTRTSLLDATEDEERIYVNYEDSDMAVEKTMNKSTAAASEVAKNSGLEFISIWSNLDRDFYRGGSNFTTMYTNLSCALSVQKLFGTYYSSSSGSGSDLEVGVFVPTQNYENLICDSLKTETLNFASSDNVRRFEKLKLLADDRLMAKHLEVCFAPVFEDANLNLREKNCGECYGCLKTMVGLDQLGKLDKFDKVFDLDKYYSNRRKYIKILADGTRRPEMISLTRCWADVVKYAKEHNNELSDIILELDKEM